MSAQKNNSLYSYSIIIPTLLCAVMCEGCLPSTTNAKTNSAPTTSITPNAAATPQTLAFSALWVNDGGDKVTQDELRATKNGPASVLNSVWNGTSINLFGAKNEVISFNIVLEAGTQAIPAVTVALNTLTGPQGATISSIPATGNGVFSWTNRNIELFLVRYLQINGLSLLSYGTYDERHVPARMRRPWTGSGAATGSWADRQDHNKFYPDIAVPMELVPSFTVAAGQNQSVWVDIYIPKNAVPGPYQGTASLSASGKAIATVPVRLNVRNFALPDAPTLKTMLNFGYSEISQRYTGVAFPNYGTTQDTLLKQVRDTHFKIAHRHKISLIDNDEGSTASPTGQPRPEWMPRLNGSLFTAANAYDGPGTGIGNGVYSIGTYGSWNWSSGTQADMNANTNAWEGWFEANAPQTDHFLYLIDESTNYAQTEQWANWIATNSGAGSALKSFATLPLTNAIASVPDLSISATWFTVGITSAWQTAYAQAKSTGKQVNCYNGKRPSNGSFATDDDGVALRELAWAQYKKGIDRWLFWESTYYNDTQGGRGQTDVFQTAATFSGATTIDPILGETGWNHSNGDGVLFYPGTDLVFPTESYGVSGPFASLRLKHWRRGLQDADYLALAAAVNQSAVSTLVSQMVPKALWEYGVDSASDPTYVHTDISWSTNPDDWESARSSLADLIEGKTTSIAAVKKTQNLARNRHIEQLVNTSYSLMRNISNFTRNLFSFNK